ncbi:MAG TPA: DUF6036 family nucleotidyltransferase [Isosphaeraceae bacterium]|nr:DUF6036 family nucleotidyltransferase [Isosphaeraceae bacterium]
MIPLPPDFKEFLRLLNSLHVEYLLIGGYAVSYHGYPRSTADMDVWISISPENAQKLVAALQAFGFGTTNVATDLFLHPDQITRMGHPPFRIEIMTSVSGLDFAEAYAKRVVDVIEGIPVSLINLEHLKINKRASGRLKDLADLDYLP